MQAKSQKNSCRSLVVSKTLESIQTRAVCLPRFEYRHCVLGSGIVCSVFAVPTSRNYATAIDVSVFILNLPASL